MSCWNIPEYSARMEASEAAAGTLCPLRLLLILMSQQWCRKGGECAQTEGSPRSPVQEVQGNVIIPAVLSRHGHSDLPRRPAGPGDSLCAVSFPPKRCFCTLQSLPLKLPPPFSFRAAAACIRSRSGFPSQGRFCRAARHATACGVAGTFRAGPCAPSESPSWLPVSSRAIDSLAGDGSECHPVSRSASGLSETAS